MDVNVKSLEPEVVERLAAQAAAEGMSQQEWIRQALRRTAGRLSPAERSELLDLMRKSKARRSNLTKKEQDRVVDLFDKIRRGGGA